MKRIKTKQTALTLLLIFSAVTLLSAWGAWGHQHINRAAVFALPEQMRPFFYNHIDFVTEEAVVPDLRKYTINDRPEFARHYINLESYGENPLQNLPKTAEAAKARFHADTLQKYGILPWYMQEITEKLTKAFRTKRKTEILFLAADLGHYIADAHMPLHTSIHHDGQTKAQKGIHAFWESQVPELFGWNYNLNVGEAKYVSDVSAATWEIIAHSNSLADTLLQTELTLQQSYPHDQIYETAADGTILRNKFNQPVHTKAYATEYHKRLNGMVEKQMRKAIATTANFWFTAWVNAGKPDLTDLDPESLTKRNKKALKQDLKLWQKHGKVTGVKPEAEF